MKIEIKNRFTGAVITTAEDGESLCDAVIRIVANRQSLRGAALSGAHLSWANLRGAALSRATLSGATMPNGEKWETYLSEVVPKLLTAGGRLLADVATSEHWQCHDWNNCPMAAAFGCSSEEDTPLLLRPRVREFVQLFDAQLIPMPEVK